MPTNLEEREVASLAAEAQYYGLDALHELLQAASSETTKQSTGYQYKHLLCDTTQWGQQEPDVHRLYEDGWELMESSIAASKYGGLMLFVLRRLKLQ